MPFSRDLDDVLVLRRCVCISCTKHSVFTAYAQVRPMYSIEYTQGGRWLKITCPIRQNAISWQPTEGHTKLASTVNPKILVNIGCREIAFCLVGHFVSHLVEKNEHHRLTTSASEQPTDYWMMKADDILIVSVTSLLALEAGMRQTDWQTKCSA